MGILKNNRILKPIVTSVLTLSITFGVGATLHYVADNYIFEEYADNKEQKEMAGLLDCEDLYRQKWGYRLKHNGEEPIRVSFSDEFTEEQKDEIIKALDYIFGIVGKINDKYRYEIVDKAEKFGKTSIHFNIKDGEFEGLHEQTNNNLLSVIGGHGMMSNKHTISIDPDVLKDNYAKLYPTCVHEILHCFGFDDVYVVENGEYISNTYINVFVENKGIERITPNDLKILYAMYHKPFASEEEKMNYVKDVSKIIDEYSKEFYAYHDEVFTEYYKNIYTEKGYPEELINMIVTHGSIDGDRFVFKKISNTQTIGTIELVLDGENYTITTFDNNNNKLDTCSGKTYYVNGAVYLQSVKLNPFLSDQNCIVDLCLCKQRDGRYTVKDLTDAAVFYGNDLEIYMNSTNEKE